MKIFSRMPDEKYFDLEEDDVLDLQTRLVKAFGAKLDASVLAIGAPETLSLTERSELPMAMALRYTGRRQWEVDYKQKLRILAVDLDTGSAHIERPFINAKRRPVLKPSMSGSPPDEFNSTATSAFVRKIDARQRLQLPRQPSRRVRLCLCLCRMDRPSHRPNTKPPERVLGLAWAGYATARQ